VQFTMNLNSDIDFTPSLDLLPFGGFDVAVLLARLEAGDIGDQPVDEQIHVCLPTSTEVSSGWLRSKLMGG
jgi:hypothetical protein